MKCQAVCFKQRGCFMQIFNSPALQADHEKLKKNSNTKIKNKKKRKIKKDTVIHFYFGSVQFSEKQKFAVSVRRKFR